ncbi:MAG: hypothetical protein CBC91_06410 [Rickettsiales bacterium TMED131]|nr:MAG: hypothetical protein CBC91_06410 [Rickettsiales bacterium TMED131]
MGQVSRYDYGQLTKSETTDEGYLRVWCKAARVGTQLYTRGDGSQVREYRPEDEVANPESLASFGMKAVTLGHPKVLLDTETTKLHQVGHAGSHIRYSDGFVEVALLITDQKAIEAIQRGDAQEVSAGYRVDYDPTPGISPTGESYDGVQRNIRINHIALVEKGRAGRNVRLLLDSCDRLDAVADFELPSNSPVISMARITLDGLDLEIPADAAGAVQSFVKDTERAKADLQQKLDAKDEAIQTAITEKSEAQDRTDAANERINELEKQLADAVAANEQRDDSADIKEAVNQRLEALQKFAPILPEDYKFDGEDEAQLMALAYKNVFEKDVREDASADYLLGILDGVLAAMEDIEEDQEEIKSDSEFVPEEDGSNVAEVRAALAQVQAAEKFDAQDSYRERLVNGWKSDLSAHA